MITLSPALPVSSCPLWCDGSFDGADHARGLLHETTVARMNVDHGVITRESVDLHLYLERLDEAESDDDLTVGPTRVVLDLEADERVSPFRRSSVVLAPTDLRALAAEFLKAADLAEARR